MLRYEMYRAREISTADVLDVLKDIKKTNAYLDKKVIAEFNARYKTWHRKSKEKMAFKTNALSLGFIIAAAGLLLTILGMNFDEFVLKVS